jgi:hypothetical protein
MHPHLGVLNARTRGTNHPWITSFDPQVSGPVLPAAAVLCWPHQRVPSARTGQARHRSGAQTVVGSAEGVPKARTTAALARACLTEGVPNARTLLPDRFDLMRDLGDRRLRREED